MAYQCSTLFPNGQFLLRACVVVFCFADLGYCGVFACISWFDSAQDSGQEAFAAPGIGVALVVDGIAELFCAGCWCSISDVFKAA